MTDPLAQMHILNLLVMTLDPVHRAALSAILDFLIAVTNRVSTNRMTVQNVATVMAPTLFPEADLIADINKANKNPKGKANTKRLSMPPEQLCKILNGGSTAMERAMRSCCATKMLIYYRRFLFHVSIASTCDYSTFTS